MAVQTRDTTWSYPLVNISSDLSIPRTSVQKGLSPSLRGTDGSLRGGIRPFSGFRTAYELDYVGYSNSEYAISPAYTAANSVVTEFFPISVIRTSADSSRNPYQIQAFVYRVKKTDDSRADVFIDYIDTVRGENGSKKYSPNDPEAASFTKNLLMFNLTGDQVNAPMDVKVFGKLIYIFVEGRMPAVAYFDDKAFSEGTYAGLIVRGVTPTTGASGGQASNFRGFSGPGLRPDLINGGEGVDFGTLGTNSISTTAFPQTKNELSPPGVAQVVVTGDSPEDSGLFNFGAPGSFVNPINPKPTITRISTDVIQASGLSATLSAAVSTVNFSQAVTEKSVRYVAMVAPFTNGGTPTITDVELSNSAGSVISSTASTKLQRITRGKEADIAGSEDRLLQVYAVPGGPNTQAFTDQRIKVTGTFGCCLISVYKLENINPAADFGMFSMISSQLGGEDFDSDSSGSSDKSRVPTNSVLTTEVTGKQGNVTNIRNAIHLFFSYGVGDSSSADIDSIDGGGQGFLSVNSQTINLGTYDPTGSRRFRIAMSKLTRDELSSSQIEGTLIKGQHKYDGLLSTFQANGSASSQRIMGVRLSAAGQIFEFPPSVTKGTTPNCPNFATDFKIREVVPQNQAENVGQETRLKWEGFYNSGAGPGGSQDDIVFDVYWQHDDDDGTLERVSEGLQVTEFDPGTLYSDGTLPKGRRYRWAVVARYTTCDDTGYSTTLSDGTVVNHVYVRSDIFQFITVSGQDARKIDGGEYTFAYKLVDSKTGRESQISTVARVGVDQFPLEVKVEDTATNIVLGDPGTPIEDDVDLAKDVASFVPRYAAIELAYDSTEYDRAVFYRSIRIPPEAPSFSSAVLLIDAIVDLSTIQTTKNDATPFRDADQSSDFSKFKHAVYYYSLQDRALALSSGYFSSFNFDEKMPKAGTAEILGNIMILSQIKSDGASSGSTIRSFPNDPYRGVAESRYSSVSSYGLELFPPQNTFIPPDPSNEIKKLIRVGSNVVGLSDDRMYIIRREGAFVLYRELHEGLTGVANPTACTVVGNQLFVVTTKGVKIIGSQGSLDAMNVMDDLIKSRWYSALDQVRMAYDPFTSCMFFLNTVDPTVKVDAQSSSYAGEAAVVWFETSSLTELQDVAFTDIKQGVIPNGEGALSGSGYAMDPDSAGAKRALFLQNHPDVANAPTDGTWKPKIMVMNHDRTRVAAKDNGTAETFARRTMFDIQGKTRFDTSTGTPPSHSAGITTITVGDTLSTAARATMVGAKIYLTASSDASDVGKSFYITAATANTIKVLGDTGTNHTRFVVSPVFVEILGHSLGLSGQDSQMFELQERHIVKQANEMVCTFVDVSGDASSDSSNTDDFFQGVVFQDNDLSPTATDIPADPSGTRVKSVSNLESLHPAAFNATGGESDSFTGKQGPQGVALTVGIRVFCPDLDFRILSMQCEGRVLSTSTTGRYSPS